MCLAHLSTVSFDSQFSAIRLSPDNCFIFAYNQAIAKAGQTIFGRVKRSIPYNTSTCIDAKTIPLVSKYLIKSNHKGSILKTNGVSVQVSGLLTSFRNLKFLRNRLQAIDPYASKKTCCLNADT